MTCDEIHGLELREDYPAAIDALEARLRTDPSEREVVIRLGFNLWYVVVEADRMQKQLPTEKYAARFMDLFNRYRTQLEGDADFCWVFGLGMSMFWYHFPGANKELGEALLTQAKEIDPFYERMFREHGQAEIAERFRGRGIFAKYYAIA